MSRERPARKREPEADLIDLRGLHQRFGTVVALRGAELALRAGEVHALLGENGAGKTTLLRVLGGLQRPDRGELSMEGRPVRLRSPRDAWREGIGLVHQHFTLVPRLTVLENLALGVRDPGVGWRAGLGLPLARVARRAADVAGSTGLAVPLDAPVERLGVGDRQRVEILKVLLREPRVVALDEPTASLAPAEVEGLLALLRRLAESGRTVLLVAHKLDEVLAVADRITVLRDGATVLEAARADVDARVLASAMLGDEVGARHGTERELGLETARPSARPARGAPVAVLRRVVVAVGSGAVRAEISLEVRRGEIVGVTGVEGNGQRELALLLSGRAAPLGGAARVPPDPGFIPQDRSHEGLVPDFDIAENVALALHRSPAWRRGPLLRWSELRAASEGLIARFHIRATDTRARARTLSGGNQQRVVVARELAAGRDLLIAENPTRGLDLAATVFVHDELRRLRSEGDLGIVLVSTDLDEVLHLADRVFVMVRGCLLEVPDDAHTRAGAGALMLSAGGAAASSGEGAVDG
jgi:simple sugar transport system ATP-binding protein